MPSWPNFLRSVVGPRADGDVDPLVLARARHGDQKAFADIVGHYDHRLRALAFRLLGDRDRMDDVMQEAYVKAYRALPRFKGASALGTWLYRITYNACLDDLRRRPATATGSYEVDRAVAIADPHPGPAEIVVERDDVAKALGLLPPDQRAVVMLVDAYGLGYAEAAEVLGVRTGTIGSRLSRARAALRHDGPIRGPCLPGGGAHRTPGRGQPGGRSSGAPQFEQFTDVRSAAPRCDDT